MLPRSLAVIAPAACSSDAPAEPPPTTAPQPAPAPTARPDALAACPHEIDPHTGLTPLANGTIRIAPRHYLGKHVAPEHAPELTIELAMATPTIARATDFVMAVEPAPPHAAALIDPATGAVRSLLEIPVCK